MCLHVELVSSLAGPNNAPACIEPDQGHLSLLMSCLRTGGLCLGGRRDVDRGWESVCFRTAHELLSMLAAHSVCGSVLPKLFPDDF